MSKIEEIVFERICKGELELCLVSLELRYQRGKAWVKKEVCLHPESGRCYYQFRDRKSGIVSRVYRNRLVWMFLHRRLVPEGQFVDHINGDREDDRPENLRLMEAGESHRLGYGEMTHDAYMECVRFFEELNPF
jgi:hypothetical protein